MVPTKFKIVNIEYRTGNVEVRLRRKGHSAWRMAQIVQVGNSESSEDSDAMLSALCARRYQSQIRNRITRNAPFQLISSPSTQTPSKFRRLSGRPAGSPFTAIKVAGIPGTSKPRSLIPSN